MSEANLFAMPMGWKPGFWKLITRNRLIKRSVIVTDLHTETGGIERRYPVLLRECVHGEAGQGTGASHWTGWAVLATRCFEEIVKMAYRKNNA